MSVRAFSDGDLMVFLLGSGGAQVPPNPPPTESGSGDQPAAEKEMNFCPVIGFYVERQGVFFGDSL